MIWRDLPNYPDRYGWAFYYYLRRRGDHVKIIEQNGKNGLLTIEVTDNEIRE